MNDNSVQIAIRENFRVISLIFLFIAVIRLFFAWFNLSIAGVQLALCASLWCLRWMNAAHLAYKKPAPCSMSSRWDDRHFNPFFTTHYGQGGGGLGWYIVFNLVVSRLGGVFA